MPFFLAFFFFQADEANKFLDLIAPLVRDEEGQVARGRVCRGAELDCPHDPPLRKLCCGQAVPGGLTFLMISSSFLFFLTLFSLFSLFLFFLLFRSSSAPSGSSLVPEATASSTPCPLSSSLPCALPSATRSRRTRTNSGPRSARRSSSSRTRLPPPSSRPTTLTSACVSSSSVLRS